MRNLIAHTVPLGGRTWSSCNVPCNNELYSALIIPRESDIKKKGADIDKIFCVSGSQDEMVEVLGTRNSKVYSDKIHKKAHELVERLLVKASNR